MSRIEFFAAAIVVSVLFPSTGPRASPVFAASFPASSQLNGSKVGFLSGHDLLPLEDKPAAADRKTKSISLHHTSAKKVLGNHVTSHN